MGIRLAVFLLVLSSATPAAAQVTITDLPLIGDATSNSAVAINNIGDAVGGSTHPTAPINRAGVWRNHLGALLDLGCPACESTASDINDLGDIVGTLGQPQIFNGLGFIWRNGVATLLPPLPGDTNSGARGVNNLGVVVGQSRGPGGTRPVRWINGVPEDLGVLGSNGPSVGTAEAINENGVIVGLTSITGTGNQAFVWQGGVMTSLGTLPVGTCLATSQALGINDQGVIVGLSEVGTAVPDCFLRPVRWVNGVIEPLTSSGSGVANDINEDGDIVGNAGPLSSQQVATLWRSGQEIPLGVLSGYTVSFASDINDAGVIVARSIAQPLFRAYTVEVGPPSPLEQAQDLLEDVGAAGPGSSLRNKLQSVIDALEQSNAPGNACARLQAFINEVRAQAGKKITAAQAAAFIDAAERIRTVIGC